MGILLNKDVSTLNRPGPRSELRPTLPKVPAVGIEKARASNQCSGVPRITGPLKFGFLSAMSVGCVPSPVPELVKPIRGVKGNPVGAVAIPFHYQPPVKRFTPPRARP